MTEDFYDLLEISPDASQKDVKRAFREKVRVYHPDLNDDERAQAQFTALKTAYDILGDPVERKAYDRLGHETYVAKRTSGLPSPDVWQSDSSEQTAQTASASAGTARGGTSRGGGSSSRTTANGGTASASTGTTYTPPERTTLDRLISWWHRRSLAYPLIWTSVFVYLAGLALYVQANRPAVETLVASIQAAGADPARVWRLLGEGRHGIETPMAHVSSVHLVTPPVASPTWEAILGGIIVLSFLLVMIVRIRWRRDTWGMVTLDETIIVAIALAVSGTLYGGPLVAGSLLMPLLFGVIVHRTKQLPGWSPSYLYLLAVLSPLAALVGAQYGLTTFRVELALLVVLPVLGGIGLPLRVQIRKRLGW